MRQIFSVRFFAAVGGVVGLFFLLTTIFATRGAIEGADEASAPFDLHRIDFVDQVFSSRNDSFSVNVDGAASADTELIIDGSRSLRIVADTSGEMLCPRFPDVGACAVVADLLGEAVVWFALVPIGNARTVDLPAIDTLEDGLATLVNGWQVRFAPVLDRRCREEFTSYREFREVLGDDFTSVFSIDERQLIAVECRQRVDFAPEVTIPDDESAEASPFNIPAPPNDITGQDALEASIGSALVDRDLDVALDELARAGWAVRTVDLDAPGATLTADLIIGRATVEHRDGVVVSIALG